MGKKSKQGAALRAKRRADLANLQLEQSMIQHREDSQMDAVKNEDLFVIDTERKEGAVRNRNRHRHRQTNGDDVVAVEPSSSSISKEERRQRKYAPSEKDMRQTQRLLSKHDGDAAKLSRLAARATKRSDPRRVMKRWNGSGADGGIAKTDFDLWEEGNPAATTGEGTNRETRPSVDEDDDDGGPLPTRPAKLSKKQIRCRTNVRLAARPAVAVEVAHPGQSYRPDGELHQEAIGEALSIEIRRKEALEEKERPVGGDGLSDFTKRFMVGSSDEEEEEEDEEEEENEEENDENETNTKGNNINLRRPTLLKKKEKLTKAQRNKQKRHKALLTQIQHQKRLKSFHHQLQEVRKHAKDVQRSELLHLRRQEELSRLREDKKNEPLGKNLWNALAEKDPIRAPALPVALTEELAEHGGGTLRTLAPKGSLVTDRVESMAARNMIWKKKPEGRRIVQGKKRRKVVGEKGTEYLLL
ncbi:hypothetical protein ACHAXS_010467 [Conticribra weissflogii]